MKQDEHDFHLQQICEDGRWGFKLHGAFVNFSRQYTVGKQRVYLNFKAYGTTYIIRLEHPEETLDDCGAWVKRHKGCKPAGAFLSLMIGQDGGPQKRLIEGAFKEECEDEDERDGRKWHDDEVEALQLPPFVDLDGALHVQLKVLLPNSGSSSPTTPDLSGQAQ